MFASGKRSYLIQYRAAGRTRRFTIGLRGVWTAETARQEAKTQLGRVVKGDNPFPNHWEQIFRHSPLAGVTPHVLRHSFANDLGFTVTIAALVGHSEGSVTSKYIHPLDTAPIMAADKIAGYIRGLLDGVAFKQTAYALDRDFRKAALARVLHPAATERQDDLPLAA